jgi:hypothetical protein
MWLTRTLPCSTKEEWRAALPAIQAGRYGVIETSAGQLQAIHFRTFPKLFAWPDLWPVHSRYHAAGTTDRCLLYYNQPRSCPNFLALKYVVTAAKQTDAILCDAANSRLSDRFLARQGWEKHKPQRWHRNFIKRFYGTYPVIHLPVLADRSTS